MRAYFVSDFHLKFDENKEDKERRLKVLRFLDHIKGQADLLVLAGDIFDLWFVWDTVIIKDYFPVLKKLADLQESGCRIVYVAGNHDFWLKNFLTDYLDVEIYQDSFSEEIDHQKVFVTHGDLYTSNDLRYQIFRKIIRKKIVMFFFELIHPNIGLKIGKFLSRSSRERKDLPQLKQRKESGLEVSAQEILKEQDIVIMGHSHCPKLIQYPNGIYINLGDWINHNSFAKMIDGNVELLNFDISNLGKG